MEYNVQRIADVIAMEHRNAPLENKEFAS